MYESITRVITIIKFTIIEFNMGITVYNRFAFAGITNHLKPFHLVNQPELHMVTYFTWLLHKHTPFSKNVFK